MIASPIIARCWCCCSSSRHDRRLSSRPRRSCCCGCCRPAVAYWLSLPVGPRQRPLGDAERALPAQHRAKDVALLRNVRHRRRWVAAAGQLPGRRAAPPQLARRTSPTNIGMSLLSTLAAHDLGYLSTVGAARARRADADDARGPGAARRALPELVRHGHSGRHAPALHLDGGQRQPRRRADRACRRRCGDISERPQTLAQRLAGVVDTAGLLMAASATSDADAATARSRRRGPSPRQPDGRARPRRAG